MQVKRATYLATGSDSEGFVLIAVIRDGLLYWLRVFFVAHGVDIAIGFNVGDSGALALASEYGRCIEGSGLPGALLGTLGWRSLVGG